MIKHAKILETIYKRLYDYYGPQKWWQEQTPFEVIIGAILTKDTSWSCAEKAINNLKTKNLLTPLALRDIPILRLSELIGPVRYFNQKAKKLKSFVDFLFKNYKGSLDRMFKEDYLVLRAKLLKINGWALEAVDSILLYAGNFPIFVVDAHTKRILFHHNLVDSNATYSQVQNYFMDNLASDTKLFNEFHALLVRLGKEFCKGEPNCLRCPLKDIDKLILYTCDSCGKQLPKPQDRYVLEIKLYASPQIKITKEDLEKNIQQEMKRLTEEMERMDKKKLEEEVYVFYKLNICKRCRDIFNSRIKQREFI